MRIINVLTVYLVCKHFPIDHPIWHVKNVFCQLPWRLFIGEEYCLPCYTKAHQNHQHNNDKIHHVYHLKEKKERARERDREKEREREIYLFVSFGSKCFKGNRTNYLNFPILTSCTCLSGLPCHSNISSKHLWSTCAGHSVDCSSHWLLRYLLTSDNTFLSGVFTTPLRNVLPGWKTPCNVGGFLFGKHSM